MSNWRNIKMVEILLLLTGFFFGMFLMQTIDMFTILKDFKNDVKEYRKKIRR
tara:strand:- start:447 stop:602 length:156 start_codon:yes stop_codon:yes gene_type:complete